MSNYYGGRGPGGGGYGMGRGVGRGGYGGMQVDGGGYPMGGGVGRGHPPGHPPSQRPAQPAMRMRGYDNSRGGYDFEPSWEDPVPIPPNPRMAAPPAGRLPEADVAMHQQRVPIPRPQQPAPGQSAAVKYANDCEIIVTAKAQQQYAEMIEKAIKDFHLKVDIMFPRTDVKLAAFIENIASMGTIFAVVIRPDNEAHRSVSVHVLRGCPKPEEHRNMPLAAAYTLVKERYLEIKRKEVGVVPEPMRVILRNLTDEKTLSDKEYSSIIMFLQDRRRKLKMFENRTNNVVTEGKDDLLNNPDADELKQRILAILNGTDGDGERIGELVVPRPKEPLPTLGSLGEPVQNPLNNLVQSDGFNSGNHLPPQGPNRGIGRGQTFGHGNY